MSSSGIGVCNLDLASSQIPEDRPVVMLNLLRFRSRTTYEENSGFSDVSGAEAYGRYRKAFHAVTQSLNIPITVVYAGKPYTGLVPDIGRWDMMALVQYPSFAAFRNVIESEAYIRTAQPHRLAALEDWFFMPTTEVRFSSEI